MSDKPKFDKELVNTVESAFKGKRLEKFQKSVNIFFDSIEQGSWIKGGSRSADSGFYQGIEPNACYFELNFDVREYNDKGEFQPTPESQLEDDASSLARCLQYGGVYKGENPVQKTFEHISSNLVNKHSKRKPKLKVSLEQVEAWVKLCSQKALAKEWLNSARPQPVFLEDFSELSPKVARTLVEMNLDNIKQIKYPKLERREKEYKYIDVYTGQEKVGIYVYYVIVWEDGIKHHRSRFSGFTSTGTVRCEACGKPIPSGMLVPLEGQNKDSKQWYSMRVGTDCASRLFGVKDVGISEEGVEASIEKAKAQAKQRRDAYLKRVGREDEIKS